MIKHQWEKIKDKIDLEMAPQVMTGGNTSRNRTGYDGFWRVNALGGF
jgi:hypothetical protein